MMIHEITPNAGRYPSRKRVGRGIGSGLGKTSGRGHKGAGSRSGTASRIGDEGGQIPLFRRLPKRGFSNFRFRKVYSPVNLRSLEAQFENGAEINPEMLAKVGLIRDASVLVKILGTGELSKKFMISASAFSKAAIAAIEAKGGSATVIA